MRGREGTRRALVCACACWLALCVAADDAVDKRAEMSPMPFVLGSRYGRSQPRMIAPRNDRFFMGSRYGKRSEPALPRAARALLCEYTGVYQLYRCAATPESPRRPLESKPLRYTGRLEDTREQDSAE